MSPELKALIAMQALDSVEEFELVDEDQLLDEDQALDFMELSFEILADAEESDY